MNETIRKAALRALRDLDADEKGEPGRIERAVLDVTIGRTTETVSFGMRDGLLVWSSTAGAEGLPFVEAGLRFLAGSTGEAIEEFSALTDSRQVMITSAVRTLDEDRPEPKDLQSAVDVLTDLVTAVARVGVREAASSPTVDAAIDRLVAACPEPLPLGVSRFIGRFKQAIANQNVDVVARLLEGASRLVGDLSADVATPEGRRRLMSFFGTPSNVLKDVEPLTDRTLLEVAREWLPGRERAGIERRYMLDLASHELFREERARGGAGGSVGPCPRLLSVGLGEAEQSGPPRRIRLLQYAVSSDVSPTTWAQVSPACVSVFEVLETEYRRSLEAFPGVAEPFALVSPQSCEWEGDAAYLVDPEGTPLALARADDPSLVAAFEELARKSRPFFVAGRLVDADGAIMLLPLSACVEMDGATRFVRLS